MMCVNCCAIILITLPIRINKSPFNENVELTFAFGHDGDSGDIRSVGEHLRVVGKRILDRLVAVEHHHQLTAHEHAVHVAVNRGSLRQKNHGVFVDGFLSEPPAEQSGDEREAEVADQRPRRRTRRDVREVATSPVNVEQTQREQQRREQQRHDVDSRQVSAARPRQRSHGVSG